MKAIHIHIITRIALLLVVCGLFTVAGHPFVHAFSDTPQPSDMAHHQDDTDHGKTPLPDSLTDTCVECVLVSSLTFEVFCDTLLLSFNVGAIYKTGHSGYVKIATSEGFFLRAPPLVSVS